MFATSAADRNRQGAEIAKLAKESARRDKRF
jgi:hypothetical protein